MFDDNNAYLLLNPLYWVFVAVVLFMCWVPTTIARRALNGRWRSWVLAPGIPFQISARNTWPFMFAAAATSLWIVTLSLPAELLGWEQVRVSVWGLFFVPWVFVILSFAWWPLQLSPRWYKSWGQSGGTRQTNPWTEDEIAAVRREVNSKTKGKKLKDIHRCSEVLHPQTDADCGNTPFTPQPEEDYRA